MGILGKLTKKKDQDMPNGVISRIITPKGIVEEQQKIEKLPFDTIFDYSKPSQKPDAEILDKAVSIAESCPEKLVGEAIIWLASAEENSDGEQAMIASAYIAMAAYFKEHGNPTLQNPTPEVQ